jgi:hypothetical protein
LGGGGAGAFRFLAEKVRAAPRPLNHAIAHGAAGWTFELEDELRMRFGASTVELVPSVLVQAAFPDGEAFRWGKVTTTIHNVVGLGRMRLEHTGTCTVVSRLTGEACVLTFHGPGAGPGGRRASREVSGLVVGADGCTPAASPAVTLSGTWDGGLAATGLCGSDGASTPIWTSQAADAGGWEALVAGLGPHNRFGFGPWAAGLNAPPAVTCGCCTESPAATAEPCADAHAPLPATDSRRRPDLRALEHGRYGEAAAAKAALEAEEARKAGPGGEHVPAWFARVPGVGEVVGSEFLYAYAGGYWAAGSRPSSSAADPSD